MLSLSPGPCTHGHRLSLFAPPTSVEVFAATSASQDLNSRLKLIVEDVRERSKPTTDITNCEIGGSPSDRCRAGVAGADPFLF